MNIPIIPAIMPGHFNDIEDLAGLVRGHASMVQIDVMDGRYVKSTSWPCVFTNDRDLQALVSQDASLPYWEDLDYELDLMVEKPEEDLQKWLGVGAARVIFHFASVRSWEAIENLDPVIRNFTKIGCAVTIHDDLEKVYPLIENKIVDYIQVMGIANIGYQGEAFEEKSLDIIAELRNRYPELLITVDGGVSEESIQDLADAGAQEFVAGSAVFASGMAGENISYLQSLIEEV